MKSPAIYSVFLILFTSITSHAELKVSNKDYGDQWPLTVPDGTITCIEGYIFLFHHDGDTWAFTPSGTRRKYKHIDEITKPNPKNPNYKMNNDIFIELALERNLHRNVKSKRKPWYNESRAQSLNAQPVTEWPKQKHHEKFNVCVYHLKRMMNATDDQPPVKRISNHLKQMIKNDTDILPYAERVLHIMEAVDYSKNDDGATVGEALQSSTMTLEWYDVQK